MKHCPKCESEYLEEIEVCVDCGEGLVSSQEFSRLQDQKKSAQERLAKTRLVSVQVAESSFEADRIKDALEQEGIPVLLRTFHDTAYDGIFEAQKGWGHVLVPEAKKEKAEKIIEELSSVFEAESRERERENGEDAD